MILNKTLLLVYVLCLFDHPMRAARARNYLLVLIIDYDFFNGLLQLCATLLCYSSYIPISRCPKMQLMDVFLHVYFGTEHNNAFKQCKHDESDTRCVKRDDRMNENVDRWCLRRPVMLDTIEHSENQRRMTFVLVRALAYVCATFALRPLRACLCV